MMSFSLSFCLLFAIASLILLQKLAVEWRRQVRAKALGCLPPKKYPHNDAFGWDLYRDRIKAVLSGRRNAFDRELFLIHGSTYEERANLTKIINTTETANIQAVGATQFLDFGRDVRRAAQPFFGRGILSTNGAAWKQTRDLVTPLFKRAELSDVERFKKHVDQLFVLLPRDGRTVDMQPLLQKLFLDSSTEFIFGESINSLSDTTTRSQDFLQAFNAALAGAGQRLSMGGAFSFIYLFDKSWQRAYSKVHAFIDEKIEQHYKKSAQIKREYNTEQESAGAQDHYVLIEGMADQIKDPIELRFQLLNIFFPARETLAISFSNALFFLARKPQIWTDLRREAEAHGVRDQPMTFELLKSLRLFRYTIFEAIRLQGPSGQVRRIALRDTTLPRGGGPDGSAPVFVRKGTGVFLNSFIKMRDVEVWGDDVEEFRPARFQDKVLTWEFTPFFGGPRICPAINQVVTQSVYLLLRLVLEFESIENRDECWEYVEATRMMVESRNGVKIALHLVKD